MATSSLIRIMISSKCKDTFPANQNSTRLSDIRRSLKSEIELMTIAGKRAFEVWINEETDPQGGTWDSWDVCIEAAKASDIIIALCNGDSGWTNSDGDVGICHAELMTGLTIAPAKVRLISLDPVKIAAGSKGAPHRRFQDYVSKQNLFRGGLVTTEFDLKERVKEALHDAVICLTQAGVRDASRGKFHSGTALDWSRLDYVTRQAEIARVLRSACLARPGAVEQGGKVFLKIANKDVLFEFHAVPAGFGVESARELVGRPFHRDYLLAQVLPPKSGGPVHLIGCNKTATESQASRLLGFSDATFVTAPFGVYVADPVQKVQFIFITNCRDESTTRHGTQRFFEWLSQTSEDVHLANRSVARTRIVRAIAKEAA